MNRTELIGHLQSKYAMPAEEVEKIKADGEKLIRTVFDFEGFKPDVDIRELVDGAFGGNLSNRDFLQEGSSAVRISVDGVVENIAPINGSDFSLEEMYKLIGQDIIELVYLPNDKLFVIDEEGFYRTPLKINWLATRILTEQLLTRKQHPIFIFGDVLLINGEQIK